MEHKDTEQKYDLYTEKIVLSPKVKYKNLIRTIKILILIIIAGVVYIAADKLIVPSVKAKFDKKKAEQDRIEFTRDEYPEPKELELLYFLASAPNQVFTREQLLDNIWGYDYIGDTRTVDVHIKRIREKIKDHDKWSIETVWGIGYKFVTK